MEEVAGSIPRIGKPSFLVFRLQTRKGMKLPRGKIVDAEVGVPRRYTDYM